MTLHFINAQPVFDFLRVATKMRRPQVHAIFVLGSGSLAPVDEAAKLYKTGCAQGIAFTSVGGTFGGNIVFGEPEVVAYAKRLVHLGVPEKAIYYPAVEEGTSNTFVEAKGAIPFMRARLGRVEQVVLCSRSVHQRRAWATFLKQHPDLEYYNYPDSEPLTVELLPRLVQEIDRLRQYAAKGDIMPQLIPDEVSETCERLRAHLKMPAP